MTEEEIRNLVDEELRQRVRRIISEQCELLLKMRAEHDEQRRRIDERIANGARLSQHRFQP